MQVVEDHMQSATKAGAINKARTKSDELLVDKLLVAAV